MSALLARGKMDQISDREKVKSWAYLSNGRIPSEPKEVPTGSSGVTGMYYVAERGNRSHQGSGKNWYLHKDGVFYRDTGYGTDMGGWFKTIEEAYTAIELFYQNNT